MATITIELTDDQLQILKSLRDDVEIYEEWGFLSIKEIGDDLVKQLQQIILKVQ